MQPRCPSPSSVRPCAHIASTQLLTRTTARHQRAWFAGRFSERVTSMLRELTVAELAGQMTQININEIMTGSVRNIDEAKVRSRERVHATAPSPAALSLPRPGPRGPRSHHMPWMGAFGYRAGPAVPLPRLGPQAQSCLQASRYPDPNARVAPTSLPLPGPRRPRCPDRALKPPVFGL